MSLLVLFSFFLLTMASVSGLSTTKAPLRMPSTGSSSRPVTYSNPLGVTLAQIREKVWLAERPFFPRLPGLQWTDVACKAAIVQLADGTLWVHAPCQLDDELRRELKAIGPVAHIVSPNSEHVSFAKAWIDAYPEARSYAAPGLKERFPQIGWQLEISSPPDSWNDEFDATWIENERAPFKLLGDRPFFSEMVFCHRPSKTLFVTDLWWNYPAGKAPSHWKFAMDNIYRPVYNGLMRQPGHQNTIDTILNWNWDYIAPCHGEPIAGPQAKQTFKDFFNS